MYTYILWYISTWIYIDLWHSSGSWPALGVNSVRGGAVHHWHVLDSRLAWYILWAHWAPFAEFQCEGGHILSKKSWHVQKICEVQRYNSKKSTLPRLCRHFNSLGLACFGPGHTIYTRETTAIPGIWTDCPLFCRAWTAWDDLRLFPFGSKKVMKCVELGPESPS